MAYIAIKPVRFDRRYSIGEIIPDAVVDPARAPHLRAMGLIQPAPDAPAAPPADEETAPDREEAAPDHEEAGAAEKRKAARK